MSSEAVNSLAGRMASLEDIIRQQEHTIGAVLQRLRGVEQYAANESRSREQAQQQLYALLSERGGASADVAERLNGQMLRNSDQVGGLQAQLQGQAAALQGLDQKYEAALRGLEQRLQSDVGGAHQRAQSGEVASAEAVRSLQSQLQAVTVGTQAVEARCRDDLVGVQQQLAGEQMSQRQRLDALEAALRDALRDVHGSLSNDVRSAEAQQRGDLEGAIQRINEALRALDQRLQADLSQLHQTEQSDVAELRRRLDEQGGFIRDAMQAAGAAVTSEIAQVAQHSQQLERRQAAAHQNILQELAKHDQQMEAIDLNWRGSVTELNGKAQQEAAVVRQQCLAADQALQGQLREVEKNLAAGLAETKGALQQLGGQVHERCVVPVQGLQNALARYEERLAKAHSDQGLLRESVNALAGQTDKDISQFKQVVEAALRAAHMDLMERMQVVTASISTQQHPDVLRVEMERILSRLWEDARGVFLTQSSLTETQNQIAELESAVRVELCALADRSGDVAYRTDQVALHLARLESEIARGRGGGASEQLIMDRVTAMMKAREATSAAAPRSRPSSANRSSQTEAPMPKREYTTGTQTSPGPLVPLTAPVVEEITKDDDDAEWKSGEVRKLRTVVDEIRYDMDKMAIETSVKVDVYAKEADRATKESKDSAKAALAAQNEALRVANELRLTLDLVRKMDEDLRRQRDEIDRLRGTVQTTQSPTKLLLLQSAEDVAASREKVQDVTASVMSYSPKHPEGELEEVPGMTKGDVFVIRPQRQDRASPASVRPRPDSAPRTPSERIFDMDSPSASEVNNPARRTTSAEVLLPTHQFVRKREYSNFKDYTKQEVDALWVEVLNLRRHQGPTREEMQLQLSQSKENILAVVMEAVKRQEKELLGMLSTIKMQLLDMSRPNSSIGSRDIRIFPMQTEGTLEELVRSLTDPEQAWKESAARKPAHASATKQPVGVPSIQRPPISQPSRQPLPLRPITEPSSARSEDVLVPIIEAPVVRRSSQPPRSHKDIFQATDGQRPTLHSDPHPQRQYAVDALVRPEATFPADRPGGPSREDPAYRPTAPFPASNKSSPKKELNSSSALIDASLRKPLTADPFNVYNPQHPRLNTVSPAIHSTAGSSYPRSETTPMRLSHTTGPAALAPRNNVGSSYHLHPLSDSAAAGPVNLVPPSKNTLATPERERHPYSTNRNIATSWEELGSAGTSPMRSRPAQEQPGSVRSSREGVPSRASKKRRNKGPSGDRIGDSSESDRFETVEHQRPVHRVSSAGSPATSPSRHPSVSAAERNRMSSAPSTAERVVQPARRGLSESPNKGRRYESNSQSPARGVSADPVRTSTSPSPQRLMGGSGTEVDRPVYLGHFSSPRQVSPDDAGFPHEGPGARRSHLYAPQPTGNLWRDIYSTSQSLASGSGVPETRTHSHTTDTAPGGVSIRVLDNSTSDRGRQTVTPDVGAVVVHPYHEM